MEIITMTVAFVKTVLQRGNPMELFGAGFLIGGIIFFIIGVRFARRSPKGAAKVDAESAAVIDKLKQRVTK